MRATARSWSHSSPNLPPTGRPDIRYPDSPVSPQYTTAFAMRPCRHPDGGHMDMGWVRFGAPSYQHSTMSPRPHSGVCVRGARSGGRPHRDPCWGVRPQGGDRGAGRGGGVAPLQGRGPRHVGSSPCGVGQERPAKGHVRDMEATPAAPGSPPWGACRGRAAGSPWAWPRVGGHGPRGGPRGEAQVDVTSVGQTQAEEEPAPQAVPALAPGPGSGAADTRGRPGAPGARPPVFARTSSVYPAGSRKQGRVQPLAVALEGTVGPRGQDTGPCWSRCPLGNQAQA